MALSAAIPPEVHIIGGGGRGGEGRHIRGWG